MLCVFNPASKVAAIVTEPYELQKMVAGSLVVPFEALRCELYSFEYTYQGLEAIHWAKFWLSKKDNRARKIGNYIPTKDLLDESALTHRACMKEFKKSIRKPKIAKIKMICATR